MQTTNDINTTEARKLLSRTLVAGVCTISLLVSGCAAFLGPSYSDHVWYKKSGSIAERDKYLLEADLLATQTIQDPIGVDTSEPINAAAIRQQRRNDIIIKYMRTKGWQFLPKDQLSR